MEGDRAIPVREAFAVISAWRARPAAPVACPLCSSGTLAISDHSARPHAEWYRISCTACGLDQNLHIPMSGVLYSLD